MDDNNSEKLFTRLHKVTIRYFVTASELLLFKPTDTDSRVFLFAYKGVTAARLHIVGQSDMGWDCEPEFNTRRP